MSCVELATALDVDPSMLSKWEKGVVPLPDKYWPHPIKTIIALYTPPGPEEWFWPRLDKNGPTMRPELGPCWVWTGSRDEAGYGHLRIAAFKWSQITGDKSVSRWQTHNSNQHFAAHRLAYQIANGPIEKDRRVLHKCDNPPCCRPDHLEAATHRDNMRDMVGKGRYHNLNALKVRAVKWLAEGEFTQEQIQDLFHLHPRTVSSILNGTTWKHVE